MNVSYFFGSPRNVLFSGVVMDVDRMSANTESVDNCYEDWVAFNRASGMRSSAYEHLIPERLFSTEEQPAEGVSTAKALTLAMAQGQRIYTLTSENASRLNLITIDSAARSEIQSALQRGFEVTVHAQPINVNGWEGSGYSIIDPERGVGAYKISGGASGGFLSDDLVSLLMFAGFSFGLVGALLSITLLVAISAAITILLAADLYLDYRSISSKCGGLDMLVGAAVILSVLSIFFAPLALVIASYVSLLVGGAALPAANSSVCKANYF
jgi:hypothetical protein